MGAFMMEIFASFYVLVIILVLFPTVSEVIRTKKPSLLMALSSLLACLFWPVTLVIIILDVLRHRLIETR